jgi:hypothetical protein
MSPQPTSPARRDASDFSFGRQWHGHRHPRRDRLDPAASRLLYRFGRGCGVSPRVKGEHQCAEQEWRGSSPPRLWKRPHGSHPPPHPGLSLFHAHSNLSRSTSRSLPPPGHLTPSRNLLALDAVHSFWGSARDFSLPLNIRHSQILCFSVVLPARAPTLSPEISHPNS